MIVAIVLAVIATVVACYSLAKWTASKRHVRELSQQMQRIRDENKPSAQLSEARLAAALDTVQEGVLIADRTGHIVFRNSAAAANGARHSDALVDEAVRQLIGACCEHGIADRRTVDLFGPPRRTVEVAAAPLSEGGAIAIVVDVTERARLEAMRTDFVANISHELKTPVGALALLAETLLDEEDEEVRKRLVERIGFESHRVARTIEDLLELSRLEAGRVAIRETTPVNVVISQAVERVRAASERRRVKLLVEPVDSSLTLVGDRRQLVSALGNLVENAVKYSDEDSQVDVAAHSDAEFVDLIVRDRGMGIPQRDLERIFERFYRVDRGRSRETGGTGLGLAIVRHVAANHGGSVSVSSQEGVGSTFVLHLPSGPQAGLFEHAEAS